MRKPRGKDAWGISFQGGMARRLKRILALCNRRGVLLNNAANSPREYDYGPCGAELKKNLINEWYAFYGRECVLYVSVVQVAISGDFYWKCISC